MLKFIRPSREGAERLVWVDAVCINQEDGGERAEQVAQMRGIYRGCERVVVYLGRDMVEELPEGRYAGRGRLKDFGRGGAETNQVRELLKRRYFSRLWVVQELILAPRLVVRIGDVDFHYSSDGNARGKLWAQSDTELAPWVQYAAVGDPLGVGLHEAMKMTFSTACADPRDRVFGVMGVIADDSWESSHLEPDYSLPVQDVFIGVFAHFIIAKGMGHLLGLGSGVSGPPSVPSWIPDWYLQIPCL